MINIAIQAARLAPLAAKAAPHIPTAIKVAKGVGVVVAADIVINESLRAWAKAKLAEKVERPETFEVKRPLWKKMTNTHADETYGQGVKRRSRLIWDIVCYGVGDALSILNLFTFKLAKVVLFVVGNLALVVCTVVVLIPLLLAKLVGLSWDKFLVAYSGCLSVLSTVLYAPGRAARVIDRILERTATRLQAGRTAVPLLAKLSERFTARFKNMASDWLNEDGIEVFTTTEPDSEPVTEPAVVEVEVEEMVKSSQDERESQMADIHHIVVLLTLDVKKARTNPKAYGAELYAQTVSESSHEEAMRARKSGLPKRLRDGGLVARDVTLVLQGFDEAASAMAGKE